MKIFSLSGLNPLGKVLPIEDFRLMCERDNADFAPQKMAPIVKKAEEYLETELTVIPISLYRKFLDEGSTTAYGAPFYERLLAMYHLGFAEAYEKKGRFTEKLCDFLWAMLEESSWMLPEHVHVHPFGIRSNTPLVVGERYLHGLELASLYRAAAMAMVYHLNREAIDSISPMIGEKLVYAMKERVIKPYLHCTLHWSGEFGKRPNNWCPWCVSSVLTVAALVVDNLRDRTRIVERAMTQLDNFIDGYSEDGGCDEGPTYWGAATGCLFDALELLYDMTGGYLDIFGSPQLKAMGEYIARFNISGKFFVNFADSKPTVEPDPEMISRFGIRCSSDIMASFGNYLASEGITASNVKHSYRALRHFTSPERTAEATEQVAAKDTYFRDIQVMILRESEKAKEGKFFAIKANHNGESHNHNDVGNFIVYKDAKPVLIDAGVGGYTKDTFGKGRYKIWSMQSNYHNVAAFDGVGQHQGKPFASKNVVYDPEGRRLTADISGAYPIELGVQSYVRTGSMNGGVITVTDKIELECERKIEFMFLTNKEPKLISNGVISLAEGCLFEFDPSLECELEEFEPTGIDTKSTFGNETLWRIHLSEFAKKCEHKFTIS